LDIHGDLQQDIYQSMAEGVQNAACVVACISKAYQASENCKLELKFARQLGVPIVPARVEADADWAAYDWLGIVLAGMDVGQPRAAGAVRAERGQAGANGAGLGPGRRRRGGPSAGAGGAGVRARTS
jgi:hypothetical protein